MINKCSICNHDTDSEPYDKTKPIVCSACKYVCKDCKVRIYGGGHNEYCNSCKEVNDKKKQDVINGFKTK